MFCLFVFACLLLFFFCILMLNGVFQAVRGVSWGALGASAPRVTKWVPKKEEKGKGKKKRGKEGKM